MLCTEARAPEAYFRPEPLTPSSSQRTACVLPHYDTWDFQVPDGKAPKARRGLALDAVPNGLAQGEHRSSISSLRSEIRVHAKAHQC